MGLGAGESVLQGGAQGLDAAGGQRAHEEAVGRGASKIGRASCRERV